MRNFLIILIFSVIFSSVNGQTNKNWNGSYAGLLVSEHIGLNTVYRNDIIQSISCGIKSSSKISEALRMVCQSDWLPITIPTIGRSLDKIITQRFADLHY